MRQKNLSKSKKNVPNFTDLIRFMNACPNYLFTRKREFFPQLAVILSAVALPVVLKAEFNFELIRTGFESAICIQNSLESAPIALFSSRLREGKIIHQKSLRAPFTLIFHSEAT